MAYSALYNRFFNKANYLGGAVKKGKGLNFIALLNSKKELLLFVFANLIVQLGITYYTFLKTPANKISGINKFITIIALFVILFAIIFTKSPLIKFILFCLFSVLEGLLLASLKNEINSQIIQASIAGVISIFAFMFTFALALGAFGIYLTNTVGLILFWALLLLIIFEIVSLIAGTASQMQKGFAMAGLVLFSIFIVYDTSRIIQRDYYGDFITASMDYYLDIINIFLDLVTLNGDN